MKYMGSKARIAKEILPILQGLIDNNSITRYFEPFVGGANVIDKIHCEKRFASDNNQYLIALYENQAEWGSLPQTVSRELYASVRECYNHEGEEYAPWFIGAIGFLASYNGRFFDGGYSGVVHTKTGIVRDYYAEAKRNLLSQKGALSDVIFKHMDYRETRDIKDYLIYCDIPYHGVKQYDTSKNFDHKAFWDWAREKSKSNIVVISELSAPEDFSCIWEQKILRTVDNKKRIEATEKLFIKR